MEVLDSDAIYPRLIRRVRAVLVDSVILIALVVVWLFTLPLVADSHPAAKIGPLALAIVFVEPVMVSLTGGTPGHHLMGLKIQSAGSGRRIGILRATVRALLRGIVGWLSFALVLTTRRHQALHDLVVRTVVVLRDPMQVPRTERFQERQPEESRYNYPPRKRRAFVIFVYLVAILFLSAATNLAAVSDSCLNGLRCGRADSVIAYLNSTLTLIALGASIVFGWRGQLLGCRRSRSLDKVI